ncbi:MAG: FimV/HubP family polar landmark protein, partial [Woeseiaceae bacterium]
PGQSRRPVMHIVRNSNPGRTPPERERPVPAESEQMPTLAGTAVKERLHKVRHGETLSGIAENYLTANTTRNQVAVALFEANPQAFRGNMNSLRAGAELRIPAEQVLLSQTATAATEEVVAQTNSWRDMISPPVKLAETPSERQYGPVNYGDTLSGIAENILRDGFTLDQMMIALFEANPQAFDGNINSLYDGALLRIPDDSELMVQSRSMASAEVVAQTLAWRNRSVQRARPGDALSQVTASTISSAPVYIPPLE